MSSTWGSRSCPRRISAQIFLEPVESPWECGFEVRLFKFSFDFCGTFCASSSADVENFMTGEAISQSSQLDASVDDITIWTLPKVIKDPTNDILTSIQSLERRTFPTSESLNLSTELSKRNTNLLYRQTSATVIGYILYINTSSGLRIHKVCVAKSHRRRGVATGLVERVCDVARKAGKDVDLWVDEGRVPARECYTRCGFVERETVVDYYGRGRNGIRMVWSHD
jgi:ribosomal protein S18 acetylase RimI-like enzyme